jgi:hypothetical protein
MSPSFPGFKNGGDGSQLQLRGHKKGAESCKEIIKKMTVG